MLDHSASGTFIAALYCSGWGEMRQQHEHVMFKGRFTLCLTFPFSHLQEQHVIVSRACDYFHQICNAIRFRKRQLAAIELILDEEEKNAALSDKKKRMWVHKCFRSRKSEGEYWILYKELADDEMKFFSFFPDTFTILLI
jgi:hypothetical protein